jgi:lipopolysaccharide transport system permease protein
VASTTTDHRPGPGRAAPPDDDGWIRIEPARARLTLPDLGEAWAYREVAWLLALRAIKARYKQTVLGLAWVILAPLGSATAYTLIFGKLAGLPSDGLPYPVFVFAGVVIWGYFASAVGQAAASLVGERELVTKIYFPRVLGPAAVLIPPLVDFAVAAAVLLCLIAAYGVAIGPAILLAPMWLLLAVALAFGVGLAMAALNVSFRDIGYLLGYVMQLWFLTSPVVFPSSEVHGAFRTALALNPMTGVLDGFRWSVLQAPAPPAVDLLGLVGGAALVLGGVLYFGRVERRFADLI